MPRSVADLLDALPADDLATAFGREVRDPSADVGAVASQLLTAVLRRPLEPGQYLSIRYTDRLAEAGAVRSVGSRGDSYDNALAESVNGLYKAEVIHRRAWHSLEQVELATAEWVDWWNQRRVHSAIDDLPPAEYEARYYHQDAVTLAA
jgi:putative transposase